MNLNDNLQHGPDPTPLTDAAAYFEDGIPIQIVLADDMRKLERANAALKRDNEVQAASLKAQDGALADMFKVCDGLRAENAALRAELKYKSEVVVRDLMERNRGLLEEVERLKKEIRIDTPAMLERDRQVCEDNARLSAEVERLKAQIDDALEAFKRIRALTGANDSDPLPAEHYVSILKQRAERAEEAMDEAMRSIELWDRHGAAAVLRNALNAARATGGVL